MSKVKKAIILSDVHIPNHDKESLNLVEQYLKDEKFDYYILLGDFLDLDCISYHNKDKLRKVEGKRILEDYDVANKILDRHQQLIKSHNKKCDFHFLYGNHSDRIQKYIDANPSLEGMIEVSRGLNLASRGFKETWCYPKGEVLKLHDLMFHHGLYTSMHPAKKMLENFGGSIISGHVHQFSSYTQTRYDKLDLSMSHTIGCLADLEQDYIGKNPSKWNTGFCIVYFVNGISNIYPITIRKNMFVSPEGNCYHVKHGGKNKKRKS